MSHYPKPFFRKSRGLWYVQIAGKQHNLGPDRTAAFERYHALMQQPAEQRVASDTVVAIIDAFLDWCQKHRAPDTYEWYRWRLQLFAQSLPRGLTVGQLKPFHVQQWLDSRQSWGPGSQHNGCRAAQRAMNWAARLGYIDHSPIAHMEKPRPGKREVVLSDEQFAELNSFVLDAEFGDLVRTTWETGCRPQESLQVEARHVELENNRWVIPEGESKTHNVRVVYLTDEALVITKRRMLRFPTGPLFRNVCGNVWTKYSVKNAFDRIRFRMGKEVMKSKGLQISDDKIRTLISKLNPDRTDRGRRRRKTDSELRREAVRKLQEKLAKTLAPKYCLYHMRHTWMNRLLRKGVDSLTVAVLAGHQNPSTLAKTYQHLSQDRDYLLGQVKRAAG